MPTSSGVGGWAEAELKLKQLGQYTLGKNRRSGMGVVYRAHHALMRRDTAVKLLLPDRANAAAIQRFGAKSASPASLPIRTPSRSMTTAHPDGIFITR